MIDAILFLMLLGNIGCIAVILDTLIQYQLNKRHLLALPVDEEYCMCGEHIAAHYCANHSPVSIEVYRRDQINQMTVDFPYEWKDL